MALGPYSRAQAARELRGEGYPAVAEDVEDRNLTIDQIIRRMHNAMDDEFDAVAFDIVALIDRE